MMTPSKINSFLILKLPSAYLCGVRVKSITNTDCTTYVKYKWMNQNPFRSMFWAVQGMAAELATGGLVMNQIASSEHNISMLLIGCKASFQKKATGLITFSCQEGEVSKKAIDLATDTGEGKVFWMLARGVNTDGEQVSEFAFQWSVKKK